MCHLTPTRPSGRANNSSRPVAKLDGYLHIKDVYETVTALTLLDKEKGINTTIDTFALHSYYFFALNSDWWRLNDKRNLFSKKNQSGAMHLYKLCDIEKYFGGSHWYEQVFVLSFDMMSSWCVVPGTSAKFDGSEMRESRKWLVLTCMFWCPDRVAYWLLAATPGRPLPPHQRW